VAVSEDVISRQHFKSPPRIVSDTKYHKRCGEGGLIVHVGIQSKSH
jgi:hypothetical protein